MTSIYFILWALAAVLSMESTPRRPGGGSRRIRASLLSRLPVHSLPDPRGQGALPSPPPQGLGQKPAPEEGKEARGLGGQREFPQKNRGTGLSGEPRSPHQPWGGTVGQLSRLPATARSQRDSRHRGLPPLASGRETAASRLLPSDLEDS